jgi:HTH-type transcriptional regulator/antitoxin HigA
MNAVTTDIDLKRYLRWVRRFPLVPINNKKQLDQAIEVMHELMDIKSKRERTPEEEAYLSVLGGLIGRYEAKAYPRKPLQDGEMLLALIEARGVTQSAVARGAGIAESTISEVVSGKRKLTRKQIGKVARWFKVPVDSFNAGV